MTRTSHRLPPRSHSPAVASRAVAAIAAPLALATLLMLSGCPGLGMVQTCPTEPPGPAERDRVLAYLQRIGPVDQLMTAAQELDRCGAVAAMSAHATAHAPDDIRVRLALMLVQTMGHGWDTDSPVRLLLFKAQRLPASDLRGFLVWTVHQLSDQPGGEALLALLDDPLPGDAEAEIAAAGPAHVPAGPWHNPKGQPFWLYIGKAVHDAIGLYYASFHQPLEEVWLNHFPMSSILQRFVEMGVGPTSNVGLGAFGRLAIKPDITNLTTREVYEIKPVLGAPAAAVLVTQYVDTFAIYGVTVRPGSPFARGTSGILPAPGGHILFHGVAPGVITYRYQPGAYVRGRARQPHAPPLGSRAPVDERSRVRTPADDDTFWDRMERLTGLTGWALTVYVILSEGSRIAFPPRNAIPIP